MTRRAQILNAFSPNNEVENPEWFAGRRRQILRLTDALLSDGSCPLIYGERGLGKTSLALQVARIALGDDTLLNSLGAGSRALPIEQSFVPFWVTCTRSVKTKDALLQRLINTAETHESLESLAEQKLKAVTDTHKLKLPVYEAETKRQYEEDTGEKFTDLNVEEKLLKIIDRVLSAGAPGALLIVDELDRIANTAGLADFMKSASTSRVKFLLVGAAHDISSLLADHESLQRKLDPVLVDAMTGPELEDIVSKVQKKLNSQGLGFQWSDEAKEEVAEAAGGYPWFVHCIGQEALLRADDEGRLLVTESDVRYAIRQLSETRFAQQYSDLYYQAVLDSPQREIVLRLLAKWPNYKVPVGELYPIARKLGVKAPSQYKQDLVSQKHGAVLVSLRKSGVSLVRFRNSVFKRYVDLRSSVFEDVDDAVEKAWRSSWGE